MKRLPWVLIILLLVLASASYAQDAPKPVTDIPAVSAIEDEAKPAAETSPKGDVVTSEEEYKRESENRRRIPFALTVGLYSPTDSQVKDVFGDRWTRWGIRPLPIVKPNIWRPNFDVSYYSMSDDQDKAKLLPVTVGVLRGFASGGKTKGYVSANAGICYFDVDAPTASVDKAGIGFSANATVGVIFRDRYSIEGRYEFMDEFAGFDFSSFSISAAVKVFTAKF